MRLSEFLQGPYCSTGLMSAIPDDLLKKNPELEWETVWMESATTKSSYPEEVEITLGPGLPGSRFSFQAPENGGAETSGESAKEPWPAQPGSPGPGGEEETMETLEGRLYLAGTYLGNLTYEMGQERATITTLQPTSMHTWRDREIVGKAGALFVNPQVNWYSGFGWGAMAQIRGEDDLDALFVIKKSDNRYNLEYYFPEGPNELKRAHGL